MKKLLSTLICVALIMSLSTSAMAWTIAPVDMDTVKVETGASDWALDELTLAQKAGLVPALTGKPTFTDKLTRIQFAELVVNMVEKITGEITPNPADTFTDTSSEAVLKANAAGIVDGMGDGTFAPNTTTNREQIATMMARAITYIMSETGDNLAPKTGDLSAFSDAGSVSSWAADSVATLVANGMMNGTSTTENILSPKDPTTVEMGIILVYRLFILA